MALCKYCGAAFAWGRADDHWVPLVPVGEDSELERHYQDENGLLRADHRVVCIWRGGPTVRVARLAKTVQARDIITGWTKPDEDGVIEPVETTR